MYNLTSYIKNSIPSKLTTEEAKTLKQLDIEYGKWFRSWWEKWDRTDCLNTDSEFKTFIEEKRKGKEYWPQLKLVKEELDYTFINQGRELQRKFMYFDNFLSKYYIQNIQMMLDSSEFIIRGTKDALAVANMECCPDVQDHLYEAAFKMMLDHPYKDVREQQPYRGPDVVKEMQDHIKKLGLEYRCELNDNMIARQNVVPHIPVLHIKTDAQFSDIDVSSLKIHEVEVHVARRYYGFKTGLNLFVDGLYHRNTLDEGLAIYNSLNKNPLGVKPNLEFDISLKTVIAKHIMTKTFHELYDWLLPICKNEQNKDIIEFVLFKNLCRFKRIVKDTRLPGGDAISESDYFCGWNIVKDLSQEDKERLIRWNIGPDQMKDLDDIEKFFELNKDYFPPLEIK